MGYDSYVSGSAKGKNLVPQLLAQGLRRDDQELDSATGYFTGAMVVDDETIAGIEDWRHCYDFGDLIRALHRVDGLEAVGFYREGESNDDVEGYRYVDGCWYSLVRVELYVQEAQTAEAEEAIGKAVAPFAPPPAASTGQ